MPEARLPRTRGADVLRVAVLALLAALALVAALAVHRETAGAPARALLGAFLLVPLLLPVRGILRRDRRTYAWATLCLAPHFLYALTELVANPAVRAPAATMLLLSLALAIALVAYLRLTRGRGTAEA
jgi:uncharacterized membrane protein